MKALDELIEIAAWTIFAVLILVMSGKAFSETAITFDDGTVVYVPTGSQVYVSDAPLYELKEVEPVTGELVEPEDKGSDEWCAWYEAVNDGVIAPSFDPGYTIYVQNCRG